MRYVKSLAFTSGLVAFVANLFLTDASADAATIGTENTLVVMRVGDGTTALGAVGAAVFLDEYAVTFSGGVPASASLTQTIAVNNTGPASTRLVLQGNATLSRLEGGLSRSTNGQYLLFGGYDSTVGGGVGTGNVRRMAARVDLSTGVVELDPIFGPGTTSNNNAIRSLASTDGNGIYSAWRGTNNLSGSTINGNMLFYRTWGGGSGNPGTALVSFPAASPPTYTGIRIGIHDSQLYITTNSDTSGNPQGPATVGSGLPTTAGQTITGLPGWPTTAGPSPVDFFFADNNTLYVADDRTTASGGLEKWIFDGSAWSLVYTKSIDTANDALDNGIRGLSGSVDASGNVVLFATTTFGSGTPNFLVGMTDTLANTNAANVTVNSLVSAGSNQTLRGLQAIGIIAIPEPGSLVLLAIGSLFLMAGRRRKV
jgi:hypothetical protein